MNQIFESHSKTAASKVSKSFKTTDLALTMALLVIVFSVSGGIVTEAFQDTSVNLATNEAERIAGQIFEKSESGKLSSRGPASASELSLKGNTEISEDPWGKPYHYKIFKNQNGSIKVLVVSAGPNKKLESNLDKFDTHSQVFGGDDIGFVYDGSNKKPE